MTLLAGVLVLAACGGTDGAGTTAEPAPAVGEAPSATVAPGDSSTATSAPGATEAPAEGGTDDGQAAAPATTDPTGDGESSADGSAETTAPPAAESAPATTAPPADVRAPDGCSVDNSPGTTDVADGPLPDLEVRPASAAMDSPIPDLAVRRINCDGGWVNLRNELPGDQPMLVWFWAPH